MTRIPVTTSSPLHRRSFVKLCATTAAAVTAAPEVLAQAAGTPVKLYQRVRLTRDEGLPLRAGDLKPGESYVFNYPYATTPCFLLDLGRAVDAQVRLATETGKGYLWPGGVGSARSLVSFSAICAHKMTHPARSVSFINYRADEVSFRDRDKKLTRRSGVIFCCSEKSVYDPARGAEVLGGPAPQPLCSILLEHDPADDALYALGSFGGEMFDKFFESFTPRLQMEWGTSNVRALVREEARVWRMDEYSRSQMLCGA